MIDPCFAFLISLFSLHCDDVTFDRDNVVDLSTRKIINERLQMLDCYPESEMLSLISTLLQDVFQTVRRT